MRDLSIIYFATLFLLFISIIGLLFYRYFIINDDLNIKMMALIFMLVFGLVYTFSVSRMMKQNKETVPPTPIHKKLAAMSFFFFFSFIQGGLGLIGSNIIQTFLLRLLPLKTLTLGISLLMTGTTSVMLAGNLQTIINKYTGYKYTISTTEHTLAFMIGRSLLNVIVFIFGLGI